MLQHLTRTSQTLTGLCHNTLTRTSQTLTGLRDSALGTGVGITPIPSEVNVAMEELIRLRAMVGEKEESVKRETGRMSDFATVHFSAQLCLLPPCTLHCSNLLPPGTLHCSKLLPPCTVHCSDLLPPGTVHRSNLLSATLHSALLWEWG